MPWIDELDFYSAFNRLKNDSSNDLYPDLLKYKYFDKGIDSIINEIKTSINNNTYKTENFSKLFVPKNNFTMRPSGFMQLKDRLLFQALIDFLSKNYNQSSINVYSNKLCAPDSTKMFESGVKAWNDWGNTIRSYSPAYPIILETDLTGYFEHIDLHELKRKIREIFIHLPNEILTPINNTLFSLLNQLNNSHLGIPQVYDPSSFLGELYLDEFDKWALKNNLRYIRYVDDMRFFCKSKLEAKKILSKVNIKLNDSGLYLSTEKTKICYSKDATKELETNNGFMQYIDDAFNSKSMSEINNVSEDLFQFFNNIISDPKKINGRYFRFCIYRFRILKTIGIREDIQEKVIQSIITNLDTMPFSTDIFSLYLSLFIDNENIITNLFNFLNSEKNFYDWQEIYILDILIRIVNVNKLYTYSDILVDYCRNKINDSSYHIGVRSRAIILLGKIGDYQDRQTIKDLYSNYNNIEINKAIIIGMQEINSHDRNHFYKQIKKQYDNKNFDINCCIDFIKTQQSPCYHSFNPPEFNGVIDDIIQYSNNNDIYWY